jgi:hypothetical protein
VIVREVLPRIAVRTVVLPHRAPLTLAQVRTPLLPRGLRSRAFLQAPLLSGLRALFGALLGCGVLCGRQAAQSRVHAILPML